MDAWILIAVISWCFTALILLHTRKLRGSRKKKVKDSYERGLNNGYEEGYQHGYEKAKRKYGDQHPYQMYQRVLHRTSRKIKGYDAIVDELWLHVFRVKSIIHTDGVAKILLEEPVVKVYDPEVEAWVEPREVDNFI